MAMKTSVRISSDKVRRWRSAPFLTAQSVILLVLALATISARADFGVLWLTQYGTSAADQGNAIAVDAVGQSWVGGFTNGDLSGTSAGGNDMLLSRLSSSGTVDFTRQRGGAGTDQTLGVAFVGSGTLFTGGFGNNTFDGQTQLGNNDPITLRYDTDGVWQSTARFGSTSLDLINGLAGNATHLLAAGTTSATFDGQTSAGGIDGFLSKRDSAGALVWTRMIGSSGTDQGLGAAFDSAGNAYLIGQAGGALPGVSFAGGVDAFFAKYDANGNRALLKEFGTSLNDIARAVKVDASGNIYVAGSTGGALGGETNAGGTDSFLTKFDSNGNVLWTRLFGGTANEQANALDIDSTGRLWIGGFSGSTFGDHTSAGGTDAFVAEYDSSGNLLDKAFIGGIGNEQINGLAIGADGSVYVTGFTASDLNGTNAGNNDIFAAKISAIPEPSSWLILGVGCAGLIAFRRRR
jgi:hypothetical protein